MKKGVLAIYDSHTEYAMHLMHYVNSKGDFPLEACVFTREEKLQDYIQKSVVDILLVGEDCTLIGICKEHIRHLVVLSQGKFVREDNEFPTVYKFQSMEKLLQELLVLLLKEGGAEGYYAYGEGNTSCIGFFSPGGSIERTSLALAAGQFMAKKEEVLYLDFELLPCLMLPEKQKEHSGVEKRGMSELLYHLKQKKENIPLKVKAMAEYIGGLACIYSVDHYRDLYDLEPKEGEFLLEELKKSHLYKKILINVGFLGDAAWTLLEFCESVFVPQGLGVMEDTRLRELLRMLKAEGKENLCQRFVPIQLPSGMGQEMENLVPGNLTEGKMGDKAWDVVQKIYKEGMG